MPRRRRARKVPTPAWSREGSVVRRQLLQRSPQAYAIAAVVVLIVAAVALVGFAFASDYIEDQRRPGSPAVRVGDTTYSVSYFTQRLKTFLEPFGGAEQLQQQPQIVVFALSSVANQIIEEALILQFAAEKEVSATEDEVNDKIAEELGITAGDEGFATALKDAIDRSGLTESEYRDVRRVAVMREKLVASFQESLPAGVESVHYRQIQVETQTEAEEIRKQIEDGADFVQLAAEKSLAPGAAENGGDQGWVPRGFIEDSAQEGAVFALEPGELTTFPTQSGTFVFQVLEKQSDRPIDDDKKRALAERDIQTWLEEKREEMNVVNHMDPNTGDGDKIRYALDHVQAA